MTIRCHALAFYAGFGLELDGQGGPGGGRPPHRGGHRHRPGAGLLGRRIGDRKGIRRFASAYVPMDEALGFTALDISNRPFLVYEAEMPQERMGEYDACLTEEFMRAFAVNGGTDPAHEGPLRPQRPPHHRGPV